MCNFYAPATFGIRRNRATGLLLEPASIDTHTHTHKWTARLTTLQFQVVCTYVRANVRSVDLRR